MTYQWDNKKPTAQMLGRWQPFHDGHYTLFKEIIKKTGQVCIQIRDVQGVDDNPFDFETVKKNICLLYTSPSPRDATLSRMPSSA